MSMVQISPIKPAARPAWATALARYTSSRREQLGLSVARAAELSGLEASQWLALEDGWVPQDLEVSRTIAGTLQVRWADYYFLVVLARCYRDLC